MAMIRTLLEFAVGSEFPDFKKDPYDLGSVDEIAHHRGGASGRADAFEGAFDATSSMLTGQRGDERLRRFEVTFKNKETTPAPVRRRLACGDIWLEEIFETGVPHLIRVGTSRGSWERQLPSEISARLGGRPILLPISLYILTVLEQRDDRAEDGRDRGLRSLDGAPTLSSEDEKSLMNLAFSFRDFRQRTLFAGAPIRSIASPHL